MFEICSVDGNARTEWLDRLRRAERSRRLDCRGRTRQERRFAVGFASRNSERRLCAGRGAAAFSGRSEPAPGAGREDRQTGKRGAERRFENSEEVGRRRATFASVPASFSKVALAARRSRFAANPLVRDRAFFRSPKFTCECGKADSWTDRRHSGPNDGEKRPPRRCLLSNWRYRPLPPRNTPSTRNGSSIHSLLNLAESRVWLRQSVPVLHCPKMIDCPGVRSSNGIHPATFLNLSSVQISKPCAFSKFIAQGIDLVPERIDRTSVRGSEYVSVRSPGTRTGFGECWPTSSPKGPYRLYCRVRGRSSC